MQWLYRAIASQVVKNIHRHAFYLQCQMFYYTIYCINYCTLFYKFMILLLIKILLFFKIFNSKPYFTVVCWSAKFVLTTIIVPKWKVLRWNTILMIKTIVTNLHVMILETALKRHLQPYILFCNSNDSNYWRVIPKRGLLYTCIIDIWTIGLLCYQGSIKNH